MHLRRRLCYTLCLVHDVLPSASQIKQTFTFWVFRRMSVSSPHHLLLFMQEKEIYENRDVCVFESTLQSLARTLQRLGVPYTFCEEENILMLGRHIPGQKVDSCIAQSFYQKRDGTTEHYDTI